MPARFELKRFVELNDVLIKLIGKQYDSCMSSKGGRRLENASDIVYVLTQGITRNGFRN